MAELVSVSPEDDGIRLDRWFRRHYPSVTHAFLQKLLRRGEVRLDGKRTNAAQRILTGQLLRLPPPLVTVNPDRAQEPKPRASRNRAMAGLTEHILYRDSHVIVINKPSGLATQGGSGVHSHVDGMLDSLAFEKKTRPKLVHRLDRDTSGVLVLARTPKAAEELSRCLAQRDASKIYWALVRGVPQRRRGIIRASLAKQSGHGRKGRDERVIIKDKDDPGAKAAVTEYVVIAKAANEFAWIAARPVTGRTHQIRVHLASLGTPIVGDFKYGGVQARPKGAIADRLHLHARSIDIALPDGARLKVIAPLPQHMRKSFELLGFDPNAAEEPFSGKDKGSKP